VSKQVLRRLYSTFDGGWPGIGFAGHAPARRQGDLRVLVPFDLVRAQDVLINCAGHLADGETLVGLIR
jgi:hypothetical protein